MNKIIIEGEKDMVTENKPKTPDEIRKEMMERRSERMANRPGAPFDPNVGKRAALTQQIKAWTGIVAQIQGQINNWNTRIAAAQAELNALPPAPVTPPTPAK